MYGGNRLGIYFLEKGVSQRGSLCVYDRAHSSIQEVDEDEFDWNEIFDGAEWFHFTEITLVLGDNLVKICLKACEVAKSKGIKTSYDLNYRSKLWSRKSANKAMSLICKYVDVCIANEEDAKAVFGIEAPNTDINSGKLDTNMLPNNL